MSTSGHLKQKQIESNGNEIKAELSMNCRIEFLSISNNNNNNNNINNNNNKNESCD